MHQQLQIQGIEIEKDHQALIEAWESLPKNNRQSLGMSLQTEAIRTCLGVIARIKNKRRRRV